MRRMLVTGGTGFIGAHLVRSLMARGDAVRIVDSLVTGTAGNLSTALDLPISETEALLGRAVRRRTIREAFQSLHYLSRLAFGCGRTSD